MLTLLETTTAIKTLNTDQDVIINACTKILVSHFLKGADQEANINAVATAIMKTYGTELDPVQFMMSCCRVLGISAGVLVDVGKEAELMEHLHKAIVIDYIQTLGNKFKEKLKDNPIEALASLLKIVEQIEARSKR